jgi:hypothetical protein
MSDKPQPELMENFLQPSCTPKEKSDPITDEDDPSQERSAVVVDRMINEKLNGKKGGKLKTTICYNLNKESFFMLGNDGEVSELESNATLRKWLSNSGSGMDNSILEELKYVRNVNDSVLQLLNEMKAKIATQSLHAGCNEDEDEGNGSSIMKRNSLWSDHDEKKLKIYRFDIYGDTFHERKKETGFWEMFHDELNQACEYNYSIEQIKNKLNNNKWMHESKIPRSRLSDVNSPSGKRRKFLE